MNFYDEVTEILNDNIAFIKGNTINEAVIGIQDIVELLVKKAGLPDEVSIRYKSFAGDQDLLFYSESYRDHFFHTFHTFLLGFLILKKIKNQYLFNWDELSGKDKGILIYFLKKQYNIDWVDSAEIKKSDKLIKLSFENKSISIKLTNEETKANLEIYDGRTDEFTVKMERGKLNIYKIHPKYNPQTPFPTDDLFLKKWLLTSLWHDITYAAEKGPEFLKGYIT